MSPRRLRRPSAAAGIAAVVVLQAASAAFFAADVVSDIGGAEASRHVILEALFAFALVVGVGFGLATLRRIIEARDRAETAAAVAAGALAELAAQWFDDWGLTPAEREVALLVLKGFSPSEIAALRGAAEGTVRAQASRVYAKAGVSGRAGLLALFVEELLAGPAGRPGQGPSRASAASPS